MENKGSFGQLKKLLIGEARDIEDQRLFHKISLVALLAWVRLGSDGLSSSCYGPESAFLALGGHTYLSIFVALATVITIICASYSQIIELFPSGGGGYLVASKLLSPSAGLVSGCALIVDYVLTIAIPNWCFRGTAGWPACCTTMPSFPCNAACTSRAIRFWCCRSGCETS
jgi:hypothetical protein